MIECFSGFYLNSSKYYFKILWNFHFSILLYSKPTIQKKFIMRRIMILLPVLLALVTLGSFTGNYSGSQKNAVPIKISPKAGYKELWKKADSLGNKGLTRSVLDVVKVIYNKAKTENNAPNFVKAVIYRLKYESLITEDDYIKAIYDLTEEAKVTHYPIKPVVHSVLAEIYWRYYTQNRYRFLNREETVNFVPADLRTWDLRKIAEKVIQNYQVSLENADSSKMIALDLYDDILVKQGDSKKFRPTLYDFLAHRAVDFFMNQEPGLIRPAERYDMNHAIYFQSYDDFVKNDIKTNDTYALKYYANIIFQELLKFHMKDSNPEALIDAELKRLKFVKANSVVENADSLYLDVLRKEEKRFISHPSSTEITYEIANYWYTEGLKYNPNISNANKWLLVKAYGICNEATERFPDAYGAKNCEYLRNLITTKSMNFNLEDGVVPQKPSRMLLTYRNLPEVFIRIIRFDAQRDMELEKKYYNGEEHVKQYLRVSPVKSFSVKLPDDKDYQTHTTEIKLPELERGYYVVLAGSTQNFSITKEAVAYSHCWVSDMSYVKRNLPEGGFDFTVLDRTNGQPQKNVTAQLYRQKYNYTTREYEYIKGVSAVTDSNGFVSIPPQKDYNYYYYYVEFDKGRDQINSDEFYSYYYHYDQKEPVIKTVFFLDRAIYRPGQTIYFKGIVMETQGDKTVIKPGFSTTVYLYDVNSQKQGEAILVSNEYGTFDGTFTAPQGVLTGQMYITNSYGYQYFSVEEYKRPKFEVVFEPVKGSYKLGQEVTVKGNAKSFAGSNIDNAEVKYRVVRTASFPYWWWYWWGYYPSSPQIEVTNGTITTDAKGDFTIKFKAIPDLSVNKNSCPTYNYAVTADVTDINGETRSSKTNVRASNTALSLSVEIPGEVEANSVDKYVISTTNLSGQYEYTKGKIEIYKLKEPSKIFRSRPWAKPDKYLMTKDEFYSAFPYDAYGDENEPAKYEKGQKLLELDFDTGKDSLLALAGLKEWPLGYYVLEAKANDKYGEEVKSYHYFTVYSESSSECPVNAYDWFTAVKVKCEPGDKAVFLIAGKDTAKVLYEVESRAKIVDKKWISIKKWQQKIEVPITEEYRGNVTIHFTYVRHNRLYKHDELVTVPYTNKELDIEYETFRNKLLPGEKEEWKIKIKGKDGQKAVAEMLAGMYDASLDAFRANDWLLNIYNTYYSQLAWEKTRTFNANNSQIYSYYWNPYLYYVPRLYDYLNWFGFNDYYNYYRGGYFGNESFDGDARFEYDKEEAEVTSQVTTRAAGGTKKMAEHKTANAGPAAGKSGGLAVNDIAGDELDQGILETGVSDKSRELRNGQGMGSVEGIATRKNFNETAFFYPHLMTDENGEIVISFTMPEALTKWKFMGLATTKDLKISQTEKEIVTQKDLMIMTNPPRFFREGDKITFSAKIANLSKDTLCGTATLLLFDALTDKPVDGLMNNIATSKLFEAFKGQSTEVNWDISIPDGIQAVKYKIYAKANNFTDGEEMIIPVLTNRMLVTETMPLPIRGKSEKNFSFDKLLASGNSTTLRNHKYTLEFTANPAWYAVQALPYLMEFPYECSEQTFDRFYANSIASHIANSHPRIKAVFDSWKNITPDALLSNLEKNQELKSALLEETPWVLQAKDESQRKRNVGVLFDLNRMANELDVALRKLEHAQCPNGGWPWFKGEPDDRYITQYIVTGAGHLDKLGVKEVKEDKPFWRCIRKGVDYLDDRIREDYEEILKYYPGTMWEDHIDYTQIQYLYARTYFMGRVSIAVKNQKAFDYFKGQAKKYWLNKNRYMQGMIALALNRLGDKLTPPAILKSLKENALHSEEMGMYWKDMSGGWFWYEAPIETQALLIEAFDEAGKDSSAVEELKVWLLKQKQTQDWKTTKATTEACYALLLRGTDILANEPDISIYIAGQEIDPKKLPDVKVEAGTGYFKTSWAAADVKPDMGNVKVIKRDNGVSWGAVYWQYFEQLDKITSAETPLKLEKKLFVERSSKTGPVIEPVTTETKLKVGDKLKVRIELRVDRDMEYIHLKDMRASGFEPINVISQYKYQDGLGYYEATGDAATNFFISYLKKGTYVFEYPLRVAQKGDFSNGITSIQCMYAPEFSAHSEGIRVKVE